MTTPDDDQRVSDDDLAVEYRIDDLAVVTRAQPDLVVDQPVIAAAPATHRQKPEKHYLRFGPHNVRMGFRRWRRTRPFWGGLWTILAGLLMLYGPATAYSIIFVSNVVWIGIAVGAVVAAFGVLVWFNPRHRHLYGVLIVIGSLVSIMTSDLGGFVLGLLLGLIGGSMTFAWVPYSQIPRKEKRRHRHGAVAVANSG